MKRHRIVNLIAIILPILTACTGKIAGNSSTLPSDSSALTSTEPGKVADISEQNPKQNPKQKKYRAFKKQVLEDFLLGEFAVYRQHPDLAAHHYLSAAQADSDVHLATHATRAALEIQDSLGAIKAAKLWHAQASSSADALKILLVHGLRGGDIATAREALAKLRLFYTKDPDIFLLDIGRIVRASKSAVLLSLVIELAKQNNHDNVLALAVSHVAFHFEEFDIALEYAQLALSLQKKWAKAQILHSFTLTKLNRQPEALTVLKQAARHHPKNREIRQLYASRLAEAKKYRQAVTEYKKLLQDKPLEVGILLNLAQLALIQNKLDNARDYLLEIVRIQPQLAHAKLPPGVYYFLGYIEEARGQHEKALLAYQQVSPSKHYHRAHLQMARIHFIRTDYDQALTELRGLTPTTPEEQIQLSLFEAEVLRAGRYFLDAHRVIEDVLKQSPNNIELLYARALLSEKLDEIDLLEMDLRHILVLDPENATALNALGYTLADRTQRYEEALIYINHAYEISPQNPEILDSLGWVSFRLGDYTRAISLLEQAFALAPDSEIAAHLGEVLWVNGQTDAAQAVWQKALDKDPDNEVLNRTWQRFLP